ncbi:hypothetical protein ACFVVA_17435 [Kitasatospora sp. NPDC058048]|uniref:hypothetical protein n=1 Tax=Kitasatospora sp. NPDC058048 TaxID=3346313 RepID=UPI0036DA71FF
MPSDPETRTVRLTTPDASADPPDADVVEVAPGIGVALGADAETLARRTGTFGHRTLGCTVASEAETEKLRTVETSWAPDHRFVDYVRELLDDLRGPPAVPRAAAAVGRHPGRTLVDALASGAFPGGGSDPGTRRLVHAPGQTLTTPEGTPSRLRVVIAMGQHGWDWWTAPGSAQHSQNGTGTWSVVSVPYRRTFSEDSYVIPPTTLFAHQLVHAVQMNQGRYDPRVASGVIQAGGRQFKKADMPVSEIEARGKATQLRHLTLGGESATDTTATALRPERTCEALEFVGELVSDSTPNPAGRGLLDPVEELHRARRDTADLSERVIAKHLNLPYQEPFRHDVQVSYEIHLRSALGRLNTKIARQTGIKSHRGRTVAIDKPNSVRRFLRHRPANRELNRLIGQGLIEIGRDIKQWEDLFISGSRQKRIYQAIHNLVWSPVALTHLSWLLLLLMGNPATFVGGLTASALVAVVGAALVWATEASRYNALPGVRRTMGNLKESLLTRRPRGLPELQPPAGPSAAEVPATPAAEHRTTVLLPRDDGNEPLRIPVAVLPGFPGIAVALTHGARELAEHTGLLDRRTRECTPLPAPARQRVEEQAPGRPVVDAGFVDYVTELLDTLTHSPSAELLLRGVAEAGPLRQEGQLETDPDDTPWQPAADIRVVVAMGSDGWDWWSAPGDARRARDGSGTWSITSVPYRRTYTEGPYPMHPAVLLGHQLVHVAHAHHGCLDPEETTTRVAGRRTAYLPGHEYEHLARGIHPYSTGHAPTQPAIARSIAAAEALRPWEADEVDPEAFEGPQTAGPSLKDVRTRTSRISERTIAEELGLDPQRSFRDKEQYTQELDIRETLERLATLLAPMAEARKPGLFRRAVTFRGPPYEVYKLKKEKVAKKGLRVDIRRDLLPAERRRTLVAKRYGRPAVMYYPKLAGKAVAGTLGGHAVSLVGKLFLRASVINRVRHLAAIERRYYRPRRGARREPAAEEWAPESSDAFSEHLDEVLADALETVSLEDPDSPRTGAGRRARVVFTPEREDDGARQTGTADTILPDTGPVPGPSTQIPQDPWNGRPIAPRVLGVPTPPTPQAPGARRPPRFAGTRNKSRRLV